ISISDVRPLPGLWLIERAELHGIAPWRIASLELSRTDDSPPPFNEGVYLADAEKLVPLHPLVAFDADSETTLILNRRRSAERVELLCYVTGRIVELPGEPGALATGVFEDAPVADAPGSKSQARRIGEYDIVG